MGTQRKDSVITMESARAKADKGMKVNGRISFTDFRDMIVAKFNEMAANNLFMVDVDGDTLYDLYQSSFPVNRNMLYRKAREHECSTCRSFIRHAGGLVSIKNGKVTTIWDIDCPDVAYSQVAKAMSEYVRSREISNVFFTGTSFSTIGAVYSWEDPDPNKNGSNGIKWEHFYANVPSRYVSRFVGESQSNSRSTFDVFYRGLCEISVEALDTVLDLISQNVLYRGFENKKNISKFYEFKKNIFDAASDSEKINLAWEYSVSLPNSVTRIRNTSIGTLLIDLSNGADVEEAVSAYERITAPENYRRPKAIFTKKMLDDARKQIETLGYMGSLQRRFATLNDITVNDILFADRNVKKSAFGLNDADSSDLFASMEAEVSSVDSSKFKNAKEVTAENFVSKILPTASEVSLLFDNELSKNMVSLIAPKDANSKCMFKWNNPFSWAYSGNLTDSTLKRNVKNAGGKVDGVLRFSIQWNDASGQWDKNDLDAHCVEPDNTRIYYGHKVNTRTGGNLDIDVINPNKGVPAVENITWPVKSKMLSGSYRFMVHCFSNRGGRSGFRAEIEFDGNIYTYDYNIPVKGNETVDVADVTLGKDGNFSINHKLPCGQSSRTVWGLETNNFIPVSVIMNSPNYWEGESGIGAKHLFFMLDGCVNDEEPNPFFNEFLNNDFKDYKRVMEALGSKAHVETVGDQLSGVGFNLTKRGSAVVRVTVSGVKKVYKVMF